MKVLKQGAIILFALASVLALTVWFQTRQIRKTMGQLMCDKNLFFFMEQMEMYGGEHGLKNEEVIRMAGLLISNTNFNRQYGFYKGNKHDQIRNPG